MCVAVNLNSFTFQLFKLGVFVVFSSKSILWITYIHLIFFHQNLFIFYSKLLTNAMFYDIIELQKRFAENLNP